MNTERFQEELVSIDPAQKLLAKVFPQRAADAAQVLAERKEEVKVAVENALSSIPPKEAVVLALRVGLMDNNPNSLAQIGRKFNLTRERIRQIETKGIHRLRLRRAKHFRTILE